ncbi:unnamed protein product [Paramecium sonneborni]|uniref:Uncharacterized protein n=1 Tax=Paramecium sonneborni TaxID=65129 RepID=A0A8S1PQY3_9CILI|nr:unnamed protein product [Paramecium sonneborni]
MLDVLKHHHNYKQKLGVGIKSMMVDQNTKYQQNRTFYLIRNDDTRADFSYEKCLKKQTNMTFFKKHVEQQLSLIYLNLNKNSFQNKINNHKYCVLQEVNQLVQQIVKQIINHLILLLNQLMILLKKIRLMLMIQSLMVRKIPSQTQIK